VFTSSTTWTVPQGVYRIFVQCWGGGGGGGGGAAVMLDGGSYYAYASGGGGGGGGYASGWLSVSPGQNITVNVGAGGVGGAGNVKNTGENA
ncbi:glycine-rich domain-containing protein, partial [Listeria monocytogenes]|uniref:glycine-rich domain-containing protein n=1 Tax=Listeria monocytogenes TaxID=1639 RepID=UPI002FDC0DA2